MRTETMVEIDAPAPIVAPGVRTVGDHRVEPLGASRCRVTLSVTTSGPLARPLWLLLGGLTERYVATEAAGLKAAVERG